MRQEFIKTARWKVTCECRCFVWTQTWMNDFHIIVWSVIVFDLKRNKYNIWAGLSRVFVSAAGMSLIKCVTVSSDRPPHACRLNETPSICIKRAASLSQWPLLSMCSVLHNTKANPEARQHFWLMCSASNFHWSEWARSLSPISSS